MDSFGAFLGPLAAFAVLLVVGQSYDAVFVTSFCIAALAVVVLVLFVRERPAGEPTEQPSDRTEQPSDPTVSVREAFGLLRGGPARRLVLAAAMLGLATIGDGFVYLCCNAGRTSVCAGSRCSRWAPAWPTCCSPPRSAYSPTGSAACRGDRRLHRPRRDVPAARRPVDGWPLIALTLALYGTFYAATDGVLIALAGPVLPARLRTTGIALVQTGQALAYLVSSVLFGLAWQAWGPENAIRAAAVAVAGVLVGTLLLLASPSRLITRKVPR